MNKVIAHRTLRNARLSLERRPYAVDGDGVLVPQPSAADGREILKMRAFHLVDDPAQLAVQQAAALTPPGASADVVPAAPTGARLGALVDLIEKLAPEPPQPPLKQTELTEAEEDAWLNTLSHAELVEVARERGIPAAKKKTKAEIIQVLRGR